jgi:murein DD-endopeptidase MepM/ murein hydrolase activator NlpD
MNTCTLNNPGKGRGRSTAWACLALAALLAFDLESVRAQIFQWPVDSVSISQVYAHRDALDPDKIPLKDPYKNGRNFHTRVDLSGTERTPIKTASGGWVVRIYPLGDGAVDDQMPLWNDANGDKEYDPGKESELEYSLPGTKTDNHGYGITVIVRHAAGLFSLYGHLAAVRKDLYDQWKSGQQPRIEQGHTIALMGRSGKADPDMWSCHLHFEIKTNENLGIAALESYGYTAGHPDLYGYIDPVSYILPDRVPTDDLVVVSNKADTVVNIRSSPGLTYADTVPTATNGRAGSGQKYVATKKITLDSETWYFLHLPSVNKSFHGPNGGWISGQFLAEYRDEHWATVVNAPPENKEGTGGANVFTSACGGAAVGRLFNGQFVVIRNTLTGVACDTCPGKWHEVDLPGLPKSYNYPTDSPLEPRRAWVCGGNFKTLDLVFCIDSTGSMADDIENVKAAASRIVNRAVTFFSYPRMAVVDYRDFPISPYGAPGDYTFKARTPFTTSASTTVAAIQSIQVGGGADTEEAVYSALAQCIDGSDLSGWRKDPVGRAIILMGDAPPHDPEPFTGYTKAAIVALAKKGGVIYRGSFVPRAAKDAGATLAAAEEPASGPIAIYSIVVGNDAEAAAVFANLANSTGGVAFSAEGAEDVVDRILQVLGVIAGVETNVIDVTSDVTTTFNSWTLDRSSGALVASVTVRNDSGKDGLPLEKVFWYAITETTNTRLAAVSGYTNGFAHYDVTAAVETALPAIGNGDLRLDPGESVTFTVPIYSRDRSVPAGHVYSIWADPPAASLFVAPPSRPRLSIACAPTGTIKLSWPVASAEYVVEESTNPASSPWVQLPASAVTRGQGYTVTVPIGQSAKFYRLKKQ